MIKRILLVLLVVMTSASCVFAQKFTKREQARREAREANYFCGASFTLTAGYTHSWMSESKIKQGISSYGKSEYWNNTDNSFNLGFLWDQAFSKKWGLQTGLFFNNKGGDHLYYYDNGTSANYGPILRQEETNEVTVHSFGLQSQMRYFFPVGKFSRFSVNAGVFVDKQFDTPSGIANWNLGPQVGLGYDWKHLSVSTTYQPGLFNKVTDNSKSGLNAVLVNIGFRMWKK